MQPETLFKRKGNTKIYVVDKLYKEVHAGYVTRKYEEETHKKIDLNPFVSLDIVNGCLVDMTSEGYENGLEGLDIDTYFITFTTGFKTHKQDVVAYAKQVSYEENKKLEDYLNRAKLLQLPA